MGAPRFLPYQTSPGQFIASLNAIGVRYVVLRWFETLPHVAAGDHIDLFVHKEDAGRVRSLLRHKSIAQRFFGAPRIKIDLKNENGDYLPEYLSARILERAVTHPSGAKVPSAEDYFYSLAYRTARHNEGLEATSPLGMTYGAKLRELADALGLDIEITIPALSALISSLPNKAPS